MFNTFVFSCLYKVCLTRRKNEHTDLRYVYYEFRLGKEGQIIWGKLYKGLLKPLKTTFAVALAL